MLQFSNADEAYRQLITRLLISNAAHESRVGKTKELFNVQFTIEDASQSVILNKARKLNYAYAFMEMMGLFSSGKDVIDMLMFYCPPLAKIQLNQETGLFDGHYGTRLMKYGQFNFVYEELKLNPNSRRAVMTMYNPAHDMSVHNSNDVPCTLALQFRIIEGKLDLFAMMRSNDIYLGLPYDLTQFTFLQQLLASKLQIPIGAYHHYTTSLHMYERDYDVLHSIAFCGVESGTTFQSMPKFTLTASDPIKEIESLLRFDLCIRKHKDIFEWPNEELEKMYDEIVLPKAKQKLLSHSIS